MPITRQCYIGQGENREPVRGQLVPLMSLDAEGFLQDICSKLVVDSGNTIPGEEEDIPGEEDVDTPKEEDIPGRRLDLDAFAAYFFSNSRTPGFLEAYHKLHFYAK